MRVTVTPITKLLGVRIDSRFNFNDYLGRILKEVNHKVNPFI